MAKISTAWDELLSREYKSAYFLDLENFVDNKYKTQVVFPVKDNIFKAFYLTEPDDVKIVIVGQDPYINENEANGLAFSVDIEKLPPSLKNIYKELDSDLGIKRSNGDLSDWAEQGVFLLNRVLTVDKGQSKSHAKKGWENFTKSVIASLSDNFEHIVFVLWGNDARKLKKIIDEDKHFIIEGVHPSPLSSYRGFFGSKPFSKANEYLKKNGKKEIDWSEK